MKIDPRPIMPGDRVLVFDRWAYRDDISTPLCMTMKPATVLRRYGKPRKMYAGSYHLGPYPDLLDVRFDHDGRESCGHFTSFVDVLTKEGDPCERP